MKPLLPPHHTSVSLLTTMRIVSFLPVRDDFHAKLNETRYITHMVGVGHRDLDPVTQEEYSTRRSEDAYTGVGRSSEDTYRHSVRLRHNS
jgi:hypothetical protein